MKRNGSKKSQSQSKKFKLASKGLQWILKDNMSVETFLLEYWEKKPLHVSRNDSQVYIDDEGKKLFSKQQMLDIVKKNKLIYGVDLNVVDCPDGKNKVVVHEPSAAVTVKNADQYFESSTIQFFQPQRYVNELWSRLYELECEFHCLWGANVYSTPGGTQGLAPHYDDVEVFVLQLEGEKHWCVHAATDPSDELAMEYSEDLEELGTKVLDVVLQPGDLLYLPRGTVHYAKTQSSNHSIHLTISAYQYHSYSNLLKLALPKVLASVTENDVEFRRGLPIAYLNKAGTFPKISLESPLKSEKSVSATVAKLLRTMADHLENSSVDDIGSPQHALQEAVDEFAVDYITSRLPPPSKYTLAASEAKSKNKIVMSGIHNIHICLIDESNMDDESIHDHDEGSSSKSATVDQEVGGSSDESEADYFLRVFHCMHNNRSVHMGRLDEQQEVEQFVDFPESSSSFFRKLLSAYPSGVTFDELVSEGVSEDEIESWVTNLIDLNILSYM